VKTILPTLLGFTLGLGLGAGVTLHQAQPTFRHGEQQYVVAWVYKNQIVETPALARCLVVGLGCGLLGAVAGNRVGAGGGLGPAVTGALLGLGLAMYVDTLLPNWHGQAGRQTHHVTMVFCSLLGGAALADASVRVRENRQGKS
jgi:hypothetical protein